MSPSAKPKTPLEYHRHGDSLEDQIKEKLRAAEKLIDEALELVKAMRWHDKMATYVMSDKKIDPFKFAKEEAKKKR